MIIIKYNFDNNANTIVTITQIHQCKLMTSLVGLCALRCQVHLYKYHWNNYTNIILLIVQIQLRKSYKYMKITDQLGWPLRPLVPSTLVQI